MSEQTLSPEDARRYVERWRLVATMETEELRTTSPEVKLRQLDGLRPFLGSLDLQALEEEDRAVRERWIRLREALGD